MEIRNAVLNYREDMLKDLRALINYNSVLDTSNPKYPFGEENAKCLAAGLAIMDNLGFKTRNLDNYCGYGEVGTGDKLIGILGHLDVVPAGEGWSSDPFTLTIKDNLAYGRGTSDDKGPVVAAMYAVKILLDNNINLNRRIRVIVGSNEESGSACLAHYVKKEGHIDYGFTPDGSFPGIHGEKGHVSAKFKSKQTKIININGGVAKNVVCNKVNVELPLGSLDLSILDNYFKTNNITYNIVEGDTIKLEVLGTAAHASTPERGVNAISYMMVGLKEANLHDDFVNYYNNLIGLDTSGNLAGIACSDEYGALTLNNGMIYQENNHFVGTVDIRYPVTLTHENIIKQMNTVFNNDNGALESISGSKPLFYDPNSDMIQALVRAYQKITKDYDTKPQVIGGGTYSQGINNCIAFGGAFEDDDTHMHDANEYIDIDNLLLQCEIYVEAILNLLEI